MRRELERAKELASSHEFVRVISHYDADGISGGYVATRALMRAGLSPHLTTTRSLPADDIQDYLDNGTRLLILVDIGASLIKELAEMDLDVIVLDHHRVMETDDRVVYINPNLFGMDGMKDLSGSTTAFLFALSLDESNWDLAPYALIGAMGDRQHIGGLSGTNRLIADRSIEQGLLVVKKQMKLSEKTVYDSILYSVDPFLKGITGRAQQVEEFLREVRIDGSTLTADLTADSSAGRMAEMSNYINSIVILRLIEQGCTPETLENLVSDTYYMSAGERSLENMAALVDACGRMGKNGVGFELLNGTKGAESEASALREEHRSRIRSRLIELEDEPPEKMEAIQYFYSEEPTISGAVAGIGREYLFDHDMPAFGLSISDGKVEISARGSNELVERGLNLAEACRKAAESVGGRGGGHPIASGATIPEGTDTEFLRLADEIVKEQLGR